MRSSKPKASAKGAIMSAGVVVDEHEPVALGPEGGQALRGEGGDQLAQGGHRPPAGRLDLVLAPAPGHPGRRPHQAHGEQVLAQAVVDGVEEPVARAASAPRAARPPRPGPG